MPVDGVTIARAFKAGATGKDKVLLGGFHGTIHGHGGKKLVDSKALNGPLEYQSTGPTVPITMV